MSLAINARFLTQPVSGVQRYAHEILRALDGLLDSDPEGAARLGPVMAYTPGLPDSPPEWRRISLRVLPGFRGHLWEQTSLWQATRQVPLLSLGNSGPLLHRRQIVAFHDAHLWDIPEAYAWRYRLWHGALRGRLARRAVRRLTVSRHSARALAARLGLDPADFEIVPNAADHVLRARPDPGVCARYGLRPGAYLLTVGNASANKNLARLAAAHARISDAPPLVVVGGVAPGLRPGAGASEVGAFHPVGRVSDADLCNLMRHARGFVFPSLHEGFGIPPLEAMRLGTPVAAARSGALPDVLGEAPIWFDPEDVGDIARAISALLSQGPDVRRIAIRKGHRQAAGFSWTESARLIVAPLMIPART